MTDPTQDPEMTGHLDPALATTRAGQLPDRTLTAIAAFARNRVIGNDNEMVWHLPEDFARFKKVTTGGVLIMGRATHRSIGRPLPGRVTIVMTHDESFSEPGVRVAHSVEEAFELLASYPEQRWWVAGGGEIYRLFWPWTTHLDVTEVHAEPAGDTTFPIIDPSQWQEVSRRPRDGFDFVEYRRIASEK